MSTMSSEELFGYLLAFLTEEFKRVGNRQCVGVSLQYAPAGYRAADLMQWERNADPDLFEDLGRLDGLVSDIIKRSEEEADSYGSGTHRFQVITHQAMNGRNRRSYSVAASASVDTDGGQLALGDGSDGPGRRENSGVLVQAMSLQMRHTEKLMHQNGQMVHATTGILAETIKELRQQVREKDAEIARLNAEVRNFNDQSDERAMALAKQQAADERKKKVLDKALPLLPVVAARFVAGKDKEGKGGDTQTGLQLILGELSKSIQRTPGGIMKIAKSLNQEQQILFMEAFRMINESQPDEPPPPAAPSSPTSQPSAH